jgi:hypothetical protein
MSTEPIKPVGENNNLLQGPVPWIKRNLHEPGVSTLISAVAAIFSTIAAVSSCSTTLENSKIADAQLRVSTQQVEIANTAQYVEKLKFADASLRSLENMLVDYQDDLEKQVATAIKDIPINQKEVAKIKTTWLRFDPRDGILNVNSLWQFMAAENQIGHSGFFEDKEKLAAIQVGTRDFWRILNECHDTNSLEKSETLNSGYQAQNAQIPFSRLFELHVSGKVVLDEIDIKRLLRLGLCFGADGVVPKIEAMFNLPLADYAWDAQGNLPKILEEKNLSKARFINTGRDLFPEPDKLGKLQKFLNRDYEHIDTKLMRLAWLFASISYTPNAGQAKTREQICEMVFKLIDSEPVAVQSFIVNTTYLPGSRQVIKYFTIVKKVYGPSARCIATVDTNYQRNANPNSKFKIKP